MHEGISVPGLPRFESAGDLFDATRDASIEVERYRRAVDGMASREGVHAVRYDRPMVRGGGSRDPTGMARTDARLDYEERARAAVEADYRLIDLACTLIYGVGQDGRGGVCALLDSAHADAMWWRYCAAATWPDVASGVGMSASWCRSAVRSAIDVVDAYGLGRMARGLGIAQG